MGTENTDIRSQIDRSKNVDYESVRREQITNLGVKLYDALNGPYMRLAMPEDLRERRLEQLQQRVLNYIPGQESSNRLGHEASLDDRIFGILRVYLEDTDGMLDIPTDVVMLFQDDSHTQRNDVHKNKSISSVKEIRSRLKGIVEKKERSFENGNYRPLVIVGYRDRKNYRSGDNEIEEEGILDAGTTDVVLWNASGAAMRKFGGIRARSIIVDNATSDVVAMVPQKDLDLLCDVLGMTTEAHIGSSHVEVKEGIIQVGGELLSSVGSITVNSIRQVGGVNNSPHVMVNNYTQLAGVNRSADIIVLNRYHLGEHATSAARHVWLSDTAQFSTTGGAIVEYPPQRRLPPDHEEEVTDDIYRAFGKELVQYFFPHDTESWSEMQTLFDTWYNDFLQSHEIPIDFLERYKPILTGQHNGRGGLLNENYKTGFGHIANLVAFFYLNKLAPLPDMNKKTFIESPDFKEFMQMVKQANGANVMIFMNQYPLHGLPSRLSIARNLAFGDGTIFKGSADRVGQFIQHVRKLTAQTVIINSYQDTEEYLGDSSKLYREHIVHISCDNLGVMTRGNIDDRTRIICNETVLQYGNIGKVRSIHAKKGEEIQIHMQEAGRNEAQEESCRVYEQRGGLMSVGKLRTDSYKMEDGIVANSEVVADRFHVNGGILQNTTIMSDAVTIGDGVQIEGKVTIRYSELEPVIGNVVGRENIILEKI